MQQPRPQRAAHSRVSCYTYVLCGVSLQLLNPWHIRKCIVHPLMEYSVKRETFLTDNKEGPKTLCLLGIW